MKTLAFVVAAAGLLALSVGAFVTSTARHVAGSAMAGGLASFAFVGYWQVINFNVGRGTVHMLPAVSFGALVASAIVGFRRWRLSAESGRFPRSRRVLRRRP
jgi:hypothetical protein